MPSSSAQLRRWAGAAHAMATRLAGAGAIDMHPTYFETVTAMAFVLFRARGCETVVLETGMGGRLDATNTVEPELAVVTPIDFDHEKFLGHTVAEIAGEKAGIIKAGGGAPAPARPHARGGAGSVHGAPRVGEGGAGRGGGNPGRSARAAARRKGPGRASTPG